MSVCTMRLKGLTAALIGLSVLCLTGCGSTRQATSSHNEQLKVLSQESEQVRAESFELARDTLIEVTTVTVQLNEVGDTVKTSTVTDRTRARAFDRRKDVEIRTEIVRDTVYIEKIDSSLQVSSLGAYGLQEDGTPTISGKLSAVSKIMKWICWILVAGIVLIIVVKLGKKGIL